MALQSLASRSIAAITVAAMLALSWNPASALTLSGPSLERSIASADIDKIWWRHGWGWGWGPGAVFGGLAAGALVGSYYYGHGPGYYGYGSCWRRAVDPYGRWFWTRVC
jgi:hypothetical protein